MTAMNVLIACESSGVMRDAFAALGHNAWSCDLLPSEGRQANHLQGDCRWALEGRVDKFDAVSLSGRRPQYIKWDLMIAHPECTYLCSSGLHWNSNPKSPRFGGQQTEESLIFVRELLDADIAMIALENPTGCIGTRIRPADQYLQPYEFGEDASKRTGLWLKNLPLVIADPAQRVAGRIVTLPSGKQVERWANQTDSGQNKLAPSADRWKDRSRTYPGIANAMAAAYHDHWMKGSSCT